MKNTKITATIWPATDNEESLIKLYEAGVNVIRFNFSHANYDNVEKMVNLIKKLNKSWKTNLSYLLDTKWPEIRTWVLDEKISYKAWDKFKIFVDESLRWKNDLYCDYKYIIDDLEVWNVIKIDSGLFDVNVVGKWNTYLEVVALNDALIWSKRHINLPWVRLNMPWITEKDKEDILWGIKHGFSFIGASFIRRRENILEIKELLKANWWEHIKIVSKIENQEAMENLDEIIDETDWIMIARWDLGIEVPVEKIPKYQYKMIQKCRELGKFTITATQMLETMIDNPFPTRAEVSDVFNAVMQGTDSLMLSWETAVWKYPIKTIEMMTSIIKEAEKVVKHEHKNFIPRWNDQYCPKKMSLIKNSLSMWEDMWIKGIVLFSGSGVTAKIVSGYKPNTPVFAFTNNEKALLYMNILLGIKPSLLDGYDSNDYEKNVENAKEYLKTQWNFSYGDEVLVIYYSKSKNWAHVPTIKIEKIG